jgi:hypothetical protein
MATPTSYPYTISTVNIDQLTANIENTSIVTALDHVSTVGDAVSILFKDALSDSDKSTLDSVISSYVYAVPVQATAKVAIESQPPISINSTPAFASKSFGAKNLFKRVVGQQATLSPGDNTVLYVEQFPWVKFMALEIINGEVGDYVSLYILDTATGTYTKAQTGTAYPNAPLNQFGFNANIAAGFYAHKSEFDADIYQGLQIKIIYHSVSAKTIGINYVMNEVK